MFSRSNSFGWNFLSRTTVYFVSVTAQEKPKVQVSKPRLWEEPPCLGPPARAYAHTTCVGIAIILLVKLLTHIWEWLAVETHAASKHWGKGETGFPPTSNIPHRLGMAARRLLKNITPIHSPSTAHLPSRRSGSSLHGEQRCDQILVLLNYLAFIVSVALYRCTLVC